jgi:hypothetical protein
MTGPNVLIELLQAITQGPTRSERELRRALGLDESMIRQMLGTLAAGGYLQQVARQCADDCGGCALEMGCLSTTGAIWRVSDKGWRAVKTPHIASVVRH